MNSQESMLTVARQTCINTGFIHHQQSARRHMKRLMLRAARQSLENPMPLCLRPLSSPRTCYVIPLVHTFPSISAALGTETICRAEPVSDPMLRIHTGFPVAQSGYLWGRSQCVIYLNIIVHDRQIQPSCL